MRDVLAISDKLNLLGIATFNLDSRKRDEGNTSRFRESRNYRHAGSRAEILEAIDWAKKAEQDSRTRVDNGESKYSRTESNAVMQIAMLYGKLAKLRGYNEKKVNESALENIIIKYFLTQIILALQKLYSHRAEELLILQTLLID